MTLNEKITEKITSYEKELTDCETSIKVIQAREDCLVKTIEMLRELLNTAQKTENTQITATDKPPSKPVRKKKASAAGSVCYYTNSADEKITAETTLPASTAAESVSISMKEMAEKLHTTTSAIASVCTELGFNDEMVKNNYHLSEVQAAAITAKLNKASLPNCESQTAEGTINHD